MKQNSMLYLMTRCALMAALMCVLCPVSIPIGPIPISLSVFVILLTVYILGTRDALISYTVYLLLGAAGMPVFSGFQGGLAKLAGPTGGYLVGFLLMILISGMFIRKSHGNLWISMIGMVVGIAMDYVLGTAWFVVQTGSTVAHALDVCVYPFIPLDLGKLVVAAVLGRLVRQALVKARLLEDFI